MPPVTRMVNSFAGPLYHVRPQASEELSEVADILVIDVAHFHNANVFSSMKKMLKRSIRTLWSQHWNLPAAEDILTNSTSGRVQSWNRIGLHLYHNGGNESWVAHRVRTAQVADALRTYGSNYQ